MLLDRIGKGGMAEIYRAIAGGYAGFRKLIAVKRILSHLAEDQNFREMFINEAKLAALLEHPNVVQIFDLGEIDGQLFLAMEYVAGIDLGRILKKQSKTRVPLPLDVALFITTEFLRALDYAHNRDDPTTGDPLHLIHRDVSPPNVLVSFEGVVKLGDFGIAKAGMLKQTAHTRSGAVKGKIPYMSPELVQGSAIDQRADLWAAGVVMWEVLALKRLFKGDNDFELINQISKGEARKIEQVRPDLNPQVCDIVHRSLSVDINYRYQTAGQMVDDLMSTAVDLGYILNANSLRTFMQENYLDEVTEIKRITQRIDEFMLQTPTPSSSGGTPSGVTPPPDPAPARRRRRLVVGGGIGAGVALATTVMLLLRPSPPVLVIDSKPAGARVFVDGSQQKQRTPFRSSELAKGEHAVEIRLEGYRARQMTATLVAGQKNVLSVVLEPEAPEVPDRPPPPIAPQDAGPGDAQPPDAGGDSGGGRVIQQPREPRGNGSIDITALPWAYISIDGKRLPKPTPIVKYELPAGPHVIEATNPNLKKRSSKRINVRTGKSTNVAFDLTK
ncbi:MAG: serine/threonine protein kinase [Deltaproteobacteria bacterium]|nr:serine/threonine protein kinase [Deltaproteobacteria bacterium]